MQIAPEDRLVLDALAERGPGMIERATGWCAINSGSRNLEGLEAMRAALEAPLAALPGDVERLALADTVEVLNDGSTRAQAYTDAMRLTVRPQAPIQVAMTGHYDTVFPAGSRFDTVVTRNDGALNGPGIADMKGGISMLLAALQGFEEHPAARNLGYTVLLSPDEEIGSLASAPLLAELGAKAHVGLTYEPAMGAGALAAARKGSGNFHIVVRGRSAHAGRDFAAGRNAIAAAARLANALVEANGQRDGVTLNVARIDGGSALNVVPDIAIVRFNIRFPDAEAGAWAQAQIDAAMASAAGDGLAFDLHGGFTRPAKPFNAAQQQLFAAVKAAGAALGQEISWTPSGGVCEGNNLFAAGLPNVDTLGVRGGDIHSENEHAWPESFAERAQLSALMLIKLATGEVDGPSLRAAMTA